MNKKKILVVLIWFIAIAVFSGCGDAGSGADNEGDVMKDKIGYTDIAPEEAKQRLDSDEEIVLLDVRTKEEYDTSHIENSVLIPVDELEEEAPDQLKEKGAPIFIYCRSGNRSVTAAKILVELGYTNVYNLGGIIDWPYEVVE